MRRFTVTGRPIFDVQVEAASEAEAKERWHEALHALSQPELPDVEGIEMAFFSDEANGGDPVSDLYVDQLEEDI